MNTELIEAFDIENDTVRVEREELSYTDYNVTPGITYYYFYKVQRSTLNTTDPSRTIAATPFTATKGDANGSMEVTVADVVTEIAYLTDQNPKPFIFEAADVNSDSIINILDVVGTINIINSPSNSPATQSIANANYTIEGGYLYINSPIRLAGIQVILNGSTEIIPTDILSDMECISTALPNGNGCKFLAFSLTGSTIPTGRQAILYVGNAQIVGLVLSDSNGHEVQATYEQPTIIEDIPEERHNAATGIYDITGRKVIAPNKGIYIINGKKVCF